MASGLGGRRLVIILALGVLVGSASGRAPDEESSRCSRRARVGRSLAVGEKLSPRKLARLWPEVARHWEGFGGALVLRDLAGPSLLGGVRLFTLVPMDAPILAFAVGAEVDGCVQLLEFTRMPGVPLSPADEEKLGACPTCSEEAADADDRVRSEFELTDPEVNQCEMPAAELARFNAFVGSHLDDQATPYALLLSNEELASG